MIKPAQLLRPAKEDGPRVVSLVRVSTESQAAEGRGGIARQKESVRKTIEAKGLICLQSYELVDVSGTSVSSNPVIKEILGRVLSGEIRHHVNLIIAHGEMHQRPIRERKQRLGCLTFWAWQSVKTILVDGVVDALREIGFQFHRGHGHAIEEEHEVNAALVVQGVAHLPHHSQPVGGVAGEDVGVDAKRRFELRQLQLLFQAQQLNALPQHVEGIADLRPRPGVLIATPEPPLQEALRPLAHCLPWPSLSPAKAPSWSWTLIKPRRRRGKVSTANAVKMGHGLASKGAARADEQRTSETIWSRVFVLAVPLVVIPTDMATLPIFVCELHAPLRCLGPHEKQVKGYPQEPKTLGQHLRKRRLDLALTQEQSAARFRISVTAYNYWEADRIAPKIAKWPELIRFLGYDPSPAPTSFGEALVALRRLLGLDKRKLAAKLGVDVKSLLNWEAGRTSPLAGLRKRITELAVRRNNGLADLGNTLSPSAEMLSFLASPGE